MARIDNRSQDEQYGQDGPIIEQDKRKTKAYSKRIIFFGLLFIGSVIIIIASQAQNRLDSNVTAAPRTYNSPKRDFLSLAAEMQASAKKPPAPAVIQAADTPATSNAPVQVVIQQHQTPRQRSRYYSNEDDRQAADQLRMINVQAIMNPPKADGFEEVKAAENIASQQQILQQNQVLPSRLDNASLAGLLQQQGEDQNRQTQKADFLRSGGGALTPQGYSDNLPVPQQFYLELKAGTVIPGILITGVNSDLPGPVMGQVSENVWDSTRGNHVLIPKGTRILGVYDSNVTYGQKRVLVVWNRLIFPNGTSLNIAGSPGLDQSGYAGMRGKVDEHWGRMITAALFASLFVTGAEIISPSKENDNTGNEVKSPGDIASEQAANVILEMSAKLMNKNIDIQPTLTIRPGRRFNIFVEKDIVFPEPYPIDY